MINNNMKQIVTNSKNKIKKENILHILYTKNTKTIKKEEKKRYKQWYNEN